MQLKNSQGKRKIITGWLQGACSSLVCLCLVLDREREIMKTVGKIGKESGRGYCVSLGKLKEEQVMTKERTVDACRTS